MMLARENGNAFTSSGKCLGGGGRAGAGGENRQGPEQAELSPGKLSEPQKALAPAMLS